MLEYAKAGNPPVASDAIASRSYGQGAVNDFTDTICANGAGGNPSPSAQAMCIPGGVALDSSGNLFVADSGNNRVLEIATPLAGTQSATRVFGQGGEFTTAQCNRGEAAPGQSTLCAPAGLMLDLLGNLWLADVNNDRVIEYQAPFDSDSAAAVVIGQGDGSAFTTAGCNRGIAPGDLFGVGADSLCVPAAVAVDQNIDLYVADSGNNRSLVFDGIVATPSPTATATATVTATATPTVTATTTASVTATPVSSSTATSTPTTTPTPSGTPTPGAGGKLKLSAKSINFGKVAIGGPPASRTLKVENAGKVILVAGVPTTSAPFPVNGGSSPSARMARWR